KLAFAPEGVPVIHPPPVAKSPQTGLISGPQAIPAADEPNTTFTPAHGITTCKALTAIPSVVTVCPLAVALAFPASCSLITTNPPPVSMTNWFACPVTLTGSPLMTSPLIWVEPLDVTSSAEQADVASDKTKSAEIVVVPPPKKPPQLVRVTLATEACDAVTFPWPMTVA